MSTRRTAFHWFLETFRSREHPAKQSRVGDEDARPPAELFGIDQLARHARAIAETHEVGRKGGPDRLLGRLAENERALHEAYGVVAAAAEINRRTTPAAEWLLDNYYLIEEQIHAATRHLPKGYSRELPRLLNPPAIGVPRVYELAMELISHVDGSVSADSLGAFIAAYQQAVPLNLGELWAIPIMLRLALIENLRHVATRLASETVDRNSAELWADKLIATAESDPSNVIIAVGDMARTSPPMSSAFVSEMARRLQGRSPVLALPLTWIEQRLTDSGGTIEQLVRADSQKQAADQASIGNSIGSLRFIGSMDWREFVETMSVVEQTLRDDPEGVYGRMDFATRDRYRHAIERISRRGRMSENQVARKAVELAAGATRASGNSDGAPHREGHVGYYLIDGGLPQLQRAAGAHSTVPEAAGKALRQLPLSFYGGGITVLTCLVAWGALAAASRLGATRATLILLALPLLFGASHLAVALANWLTTLLIKPRALPKMDFLHGIPPDRRGLVVIPTMIGSTRDCMELVEGLEVRYLANRDENLWFALLTDFPDAPGETTPDDDEVIDCARRGIDALNEKYQNDGTGPFLLLHRPRRWNESEKVWMGWERKRGKLSQLNALLRGKGETGFSHIIGDISHFPSIKYVITLDTDTQLPRDCARELVGAIAHPLNEAHCDTRTRRVTQGYSILQPRVAISLPSSNRSWYVRLFAGEAGIDPYTRAVSDVYQDLFAEGSFIGKGIYDVDAFECALCDRFPENRILSHDLLEGCHARAALLSDVQLYEHFPSHYGADVSRRHRWIRGDWQIAPWILPRVPGPGGQTQANSLTPLSRWKIFDNLRRSLVSPALLLLLAGGWLLAGPSWFWSALVLVIVMLPFALDSLVELLHKGADIPAHVHLREVAHSVTRRAAQGALTLALLPYDAFFSLDAVLRTSLRMWRTHRNLLEWRTSSSTESSASTSPVNFVRTMWFAPAAALVIHILLSGKGLRTFLAAEPFIALWIASPGLAWWLSRPIPAMKSRISPHQSLRLRKLARKTWRFFETFVGPEDNWLPPDNFQEFPSPLVAHRTSPTNIGLGLLANLAAHDFGYISADVVTMRISNALETIKGLERYRGHLLNWYDTRTLQPLTPMYVSTVDSGNLAGYGLTLRAGLLEMADQPVLPRRAFAGILDTLCVLSAAVAESRGAASAGLSSREAADLTERISHLQHELRYTPATLAASIVLLHRLAATSAELVPNAGTASDGEVLWWIRAFEAQCRDHLDFLTALCPWSAGPPPPAFDGVEPVPDLTEILQWFDTVPSLSALANIESDLLPKIDAILANAATPPAARDWLAEQRPTLVAAPGRAAARIAALERLALTCGEFAEIEYGFLYDDARKLMTIGYNVTEHRRDAGFYDLLASEARVGSFLAIAQGLVPQEHWFALGRMLTASRGRPTLLSWGGSMFEYLMPQLILPAYEDTLLDETCKAAVERQIKYGAELGIPWGMSESGYNLTDASLNYQYRAFGVPGLGLKRGLADDMVIAPYATVMALMIRPDAACKNLERLTREGAAGRYGFYEAVDYTASRLSAGEKRAVVQSFMAHHQGMSFLALASVLLDKPMQRRFAADPIFQATELLLQEKIPRAAPIFPHADEVSGVHRIEEGEAAVRIYSSPNTPSPEVHLLSNGRYSVVITNSGAGYSRWREFALTRWDEDTTRDHWGMFCYVRDLATNGFWSTTHQPTLKSTKDFTAVFPLARAEFRCRKNGIETLTEVAVSPEDDIELRRVTITNLTDAPRTLELTSYAEVALAPPAADTAHPAFSKLFVETETIKERDAILCTRRPRSHDEIPPWMFHLMGVSGGGESQPSFETDRHKFIGRGHTAIDPQAMATPGPLSGGEGTVLDPIVAIRRKVTIEPNGVATAYFVTGAAPTREAASVLIEKYHDRALGDRVFSLAWTHGQVLLRQLNISDTEAQLYERLAGSIIYPASLRRAAPAVLIRNRRQQSALWGYGISGDLPILLLRISDTASIDMVRQLIQAHAYWRLKGLPVDLVILNDDQSGYRQLLHDEIMGIIASGTESGIVDRPGGIFLRRTDQIPEDDRVLIEAAARAIIADTAGTLVEQVERRGRAFAPAPPFLPSAALRKFATGIKPPFPRAAEAPAAKAEAPRDIEALRRELICFNGVGGFTRDGREYVIRLVPGADTPMPWANVLANPQFGTVVSESGGSYTWCENAHEFRLTPWHNDPVSDSGGEAFYVRDEETGRFWSPTLLPARGSQPYTTRHGFGYTIFESVENGIASELCVYVATDASVKFSVLKLRNQSGRRRRLSATGFVEWTLGSQRAKSSMHISTEVDPKSGALFARNPFNNEFPDRVAFFDLAETARTFTGDRAEFLGRNGSFANPAAMLRARLSGKVGAGLDPCAAIQTHFDLADGQERELVFVLGSGGNADDARNLAQRFRGSGPARQALEGVWSFWKQSLGAVYLETPDPATNVLANGWLLYQAWACRMWGRSGYYQSGGAFGFRDQLQDSLSLLHSAPWLIREHLLRCAAHQFTEGDVAHWWHPPTDRGVRTHFSDDYLWLPWVASQYVETIGDTGILDEPVRFIEGRPVKPEEESYYDLPNRSEESAPFYEHCVRAIRNGLKYGEHGLPLMGGGDWNDGMNLVGAKGRGESVWLAFFLYDVLTRFEGLAARRGDIAFSDLCKTEAAQLRQNIDAGAWDGDWYLRAFTDEGEALGSAAAPECQIDSIPQSWSVLSGAGDPRRQRTAMAAVNKRLIRRDARLIQLFDPPFDKSPLDPGYVKGYPPGVRENGGQYTHAAIWTAMAYATLGDTERLWEIFRMINPVSLSSTPERCAIYRVEPYVVAADIYGAAPHTGKGGWTWYTGSAAWMHRLIIESIIGLRLRVDRLTFAPRIPAEWKSFKLHYRFRETFYHIQFTRIGAGLEVTRVTLDGVDQPDKSIPLRDDRQEHSAQVEI